MMAELTEKFCNISDDSARKKHKKRSGRVGLAELVLAELSGNRAGWQEFFLLFFLFSEFCVNVFQKARRSIQGELKSESDSFIQFAE